MILFTHKAGDYLDFYHLIEIDLFYVKLHTLINIFYINNFFNITK